MHSSLADKDLDKLHYEVLRNWTDDRLAFRYRGLDFFELSQFSLWDKVGRAIRTSINPGYTEMVPAAPSPANLFYKFSHSLSLKKHILRGDLTAKRVLVPARPRILDPIIDHLDKKSRIRVITTRFDWEKYTKRAYFSLSGKDYAFIRLLTESVFSGTRAFGITLSDRDMANFTAEMEMVLSALPKVEGDLNEFRPDLLLVHVDNHPPYQIYIQVAHGMNIPVLMFQHGMDCEHYILENAYAGHIAVWGNNRKKRYEDYSEFRSDVRVTGNPFFESYRGDGSGDKNKLIWITRPHIATKCYSPYRYPSEGSSILQALINYLKKNNNIHLVVRPHPFADLQGFRILAAESGFKDRISFDTESPIKELIRNSGLVLAEDSTVILETMLLSKPLIQVQFAENQPVLKAAEYGAARIAKNEKDLHDGIADYVHDNEFFLRSQKAGQENYIRDHLCEQDGESLSRIFTFVSDCFKLTMKKVGFISLNDHVPWGGSEVFWSDLADKILDKPGFEVAIASKQWDNTPSRIKELLDRGALNYLRKPDKKLRIYQLIANKFLPKVFKIKPKRSQARIIREYKPDLLVISLGDHNRGHDWMKLCRAYEIPYILIVQLVKEAHYPVDTEPLYHNLKEGYLHAEKVLVPSYDNLHLLEKQFATKLINAEIINNPINNPEEFPPYPDGDVHQVAVVASLNMNHKGQDLLIDCLRQEKWKNRPIQFNLYGKGAHANIIKNLIELHKIENIKLCGHTDLYDIWKSNQILCMPSRMEGLSLAFLEALNCERTAVVTNLGDTARFIRDDENGFIIKAPQADMLDEALERAWARRMEWKEMGIKAKNALKSSIQSDPVTQIADKIESYIRY